MDKGGTMDTFLGSLTAPLPEKVLNSICENQYS